jgi:hypothetical protein
MYWDLQRQRCENLQCHEYPRVFLKQKHFLLGTLKTL